MGDLTRACMNRSMHAGSPRRDNAEEVAKRRAAMQRVLEQRREETRRLQEEKMARAAAQKEERLQRQRELQQKEAQRMQAALQRRNAALAEEKLKKAAVIAKAEQVASRHPIQQKARSVYAFGSSTPRELGYLTQLSKQQQVYDRKLQPSSAGISSSALNSSRHLSSTSRSVQMTRSMYLPSNDSARRNTGRSIPSVMSRSVYSPQSFSKNLQLLNTTPRRTSSKDIVKQHKVGNADLASQHHTDEKTNSNPKVVTKPKKNKERVPYNELEKSKVNKREGTKKKTLIARSGVVKIEKNDVTVRNSLESKVTETKKATSDVSAEGHALKCSVDGILDIETNHKDERSLANTSDMSDHSEAVLDGQGGESGINEIRESTSFYNRPVLEEASLSKFTYSDQKINEIAKNDIYDNVATNDKDELKLLVCKEDRESGNTIVDVATVPLPKCQTDGDLKDHSSSIEVELANVKPTIYETPIDSGTSITNENSTTTMKMEDVNIINNKCSEELVSDTLDSAYINMNNNELLPLSANSSNNSLGMLNEGNENNSYTENSGIASVKALEQEPEVTVNKKFSTDTAKNTVIGEFTQPLSVEGSDGVISDAANLHVSIDSMSGTTENSVVATDSFTEMSEQSNHNSEQIILSGESFVSNNAQVEKVNVLEDRNGNVNASVNNDSAVATTGTGTGADSGASTDNGQLKAGVVASETDKQQNEDRESIEMSKYSEAQREREERRARLAAIMRRTRGTPTAVVAPNTQRSNDNDDKNLLSHSNEVKESRVMDIKDMHRFSSEKTASILQRLASSNPQLISSNPHLMSLLQRNGSNQSLADELSAADRQSLPTAASVAYDRSKESPLSAVQSNSFSNESEKQQSVAT